MSPRRVFPVLYLLSGATGLLYQVAWSRALTLEMGHTAAAVSTVLAAFMGGLAIGAIAGGRRAGHVDGGAALRSYAALEAFVGLAALLVAPVLSLSAPILAAAYRDGSGGIGFATLRLALSLTVVALPATAMGATLPFAVRWLETSAPASAGRLAGRLYVLNTLGAAFGAALTGFVLLPALGLTLTTLTGVLTNATVAVVAWRLARPAPLDTPIAATRARGRAVKPGKSTARSREVARQTPAEAAAPWTASIALLVSGFAALVHEVAWTRVLALVIGPTTYAFTTMVTAFIVGLAGGGAIGTGLLRSGRSPLRLLVWAQCLAAAAAIGATAAVPRLPFIVAAVVGDASDRYWQVLLTESVLVFLLLSPLTLALGASFPLAVAAADAGRDSAARPAARVYAWNTVGAIGGALAGGFVLLPLLGLQGTITTAAVLGLLVACGMAIGTPALRTMRAAVAGFTLAAAVSAWAMPPWSQTLLAAGLYRRAPQANFDPRVEVEAGALLYYGDGPTGTVSVRRVAGEISLAINGKVDASNAGDMLTQKLLAHLPLLLHPSPRTVGIIGLGSGVTAGAALTHPVSTVDTIELSPEVVLASRFFDADSHRPLADPRSRLIVGDGRTHLRLGRRTYDTIISEPSNPWMAGVAPLFTREMFDAARARLRPGGVFCQWAHTYQMSEADLASIVATFLTAFPDGSLWLVGEADVLLIGTRDGSIDARLAQLEARWRDTAAVMRDLERVKVHDPASVLALHVAGGRALATFAGAARVQTDDRTALEFSAPLTLYARAGLALVERLRALARDHAQPGPVAAALSSRDAESWRHRSEMYVAAEAYGPAFDAASRAMALDPSSTAADLLVKAAVPLDRQRGAASMLEQSIAAGSGGLAPRLALSRLRATSGDLEGAIRVAAEAVDAHPDRGDAWEQLASVLGDVGDADKLETAVAELTRRAPTAWGASYYAATVRFLRGDFAAAATLGDRAAELRPGDGRALNLAGAARASLGDVGSARRAFEASLIRDPRDPATYINLARLELTSGNGRRAAELFSEALVLDPSSRDAREGLDGARPVSH
jgi:spermidine synthase